jgi:hypothetical protein
MQSKGVFEDNAANSISPKYKGPELYPKMFYHPDGLERVTVPADTQVTPYGPIKLWEQREIIHRIANNQEEADELRALGWHDHPTKAMLAAGKDVPEAASVVDGDRVIDLEARIRALEAELAAAKIGKVSEVA